MEKVLVNMIRAGGWCILKVLVRKQCCWEPEKKLLWGPETKDDLWGPETNIICFQIRKGRLCDMCYQGMAIPRNAGSLDEMSFGCLGERERKIA